MLRISAEEKNLLNELRGRISDVLEHENEYRNSDAFLINWLLHKNRDVPQVESAFRKHTKWRHEQKIEEIHKETIEDLDQLLPYELHGVDKAGRPIVWMQLGRWDLASLSKADRDDQVKRYSYQFCENIERAIIREQGRLDEKKRNRQEGEEVVWQFTGVFDMEGFSYRQIMNARTIRLITSLAAATEANWPLRCGCAMLINSPAIIKTFLTIIKPFLSKSTKNGIRVHGSSREEWEHALRTLIDSANIPIELGGTRQSPLYDTATATTATTATVLPDEDE